MKIFSDLVLIKQILGLRQNLHKNGFSEETDFRKLINRW